MIRLLILIVCFAGSANAQCASVAMSPFQLVQREQGITRLPINLFPVMADTETITYASCPVIPHEIEAEGDVTDCRIGVTARNGDAISLEPLGNCSAEHEWSPGCPAFTAEGYTASNRSAVEDLINAQNLNCSEETRPRPLAEQSERNGDGLHKDDRIYAIEVLASCEEFSDRVQKICSALPDTTKPFFAFEAAGLTTVCILDDNRRLTACRSG